MALRWEWERTGEWLRRWESPTEEVPLNHDIVDDVGECFGGDETVDGLGRGSIELLYR